MSINPLNEISAVYIKEVLEPQLGKKNSRPAPTKKVEKGKDDAESSAKRIRQAVYDIRYRARREDVKLDQAYNQYMSHTTMSGPEKTAVKEKLGLISGSGAVSEEVDAKKGKFKVRVTDKTTGKSYVRYATREKITQLRANPNIKSVEMTSYGQPYEGEQTRGSYTAKAKSGKGLDPVGREDSRGDVDNDGIPASKDKNDQYLLNRRKTIGKAISSKKTSVKEEFSNWREDLVEIVGKSEQPRMITGKGKKTTKVIINPTLPEAVKNLGGELVEMTEIDERTVNPYAVGMAAAMKSTGDKPPLKKSTITKAHKIAKKVEATEEVMQPSSTQKPNQAQNTQQQNKPTPEDRRLAAIQKTQLAAKLKQVQRGVPLSASYDPEGELVDEKFATQYGKPNKLSQSSQRKSLGRGSSIKDGSKSTGYESKKEFRDTEMKYQKNSFDPEGESIDELTRYEKETGKDYKTGKPSVKGGTLSGDDVGSKAMRFVMKSMGSGRMGVQPRGKKKVPGKKPPAAGEYGSERPSPAQQLAAKRSAERRAKEMQSSRFD